MIKLQWHQTENYICDLGALLHVNGPLQPMIMTKYELANKSVTWKTFTIELAYDSLLAVRTVN